MQTRIRADPRRAVTPTRWRADPRCAVTVCCIPFFLFTLFAATPDTAYSPVLSLRLLYFSRRVALLYSTLFVIYGRQSNVRLPGYVLSILPSLLLVALSLYMYLSTSLAQTSLP